jgi:UDP-sulfoquinovose synthase
MQGPVYGIFTNETRRDERLFPNFNYDDIFGTVLNRFIVQAVAGIPLTVYGKGNQVRGYLNLVDTLRCVELSANSVPENGELKIYNQFTETFSVNKLAEIVKSSAQTLGLQVEVKSVQNPRKEMEDHYYNPKSTKLRALGLEPTLLTQDVIVELLRSVINQKDNINVSSILPRVSWSK